MDSNLLRRLNWLWGHRHTHDDDDTDDQITTIVHRIDTLIDNTSGTGTGAHIHVQRSSAQAIGTATEPIEWDSYNGLLPRLEFADVSFPATAVAVVKEGYYNVQVAVQMATAVTTPSVSIVRTRNEIDVTVYPPSAEADLWTADYSSSLFGGVAAAIPFEAGDELKVNVGHGEASSQNMDSATLAFYLVDRTGGGNVSAGSEAYRELVLSDGPIAYWRLGESSIAKSAHDETGNGHVGTYNPSSGDVIVVGQDPLIAGTPDTSVLFDGSTNQVVACSTGVSDFNVAAMTLEAWIDTDYAGANDLTIISRFDQQDEIIWGLQVPSTGVVRFQVLSGTSTVEGTASGVTDVRDGETHHVAVTYDGTTAKIYVDGSLDSETNLSDALGSSGTVDVFVGAVVNTLGFTTESWSGVLDEVAVYGRVLSLAEIQQHNLVGRSG